MTLAQRTVDTNDARPTLRRDDGSARPENWLRCIVASDRREQLLGIALATAVIVIPARVLPQDAARRPGARRSHFVQSLP